MKTIYATLYQQYFDQVARGTKKTEYRTMSDYWIRRLVDVDKYSTNNLSEIKNGIVSGKLPQHYKDWTHIRFKCGNSYLLCEIKGINVYRGHDIFCIKLGKVTPDDGTYKEQ